MACLASACQHMVCGYVFLFVLRYSCCPCNATHVCGLSSKGSQLQGAHAAPAAAQVHADFEFIGRAASLSTVCLYGGAPYGPQEGVLRRGCDVVVGTPGRVKDHLERGSLKLQDLKCVPSLCCSTVLYCRLRYFTRLLGFAWHASVVYLGRMHCSAR